MAGSPQLLYHLARNAGRVLPHRALLDRVWGAEYVATPEYLKVFVSRLRAKLARPGGPRYIETERGLGYLYRLRNRIERLLARCKQCRSLATRYDQRAESYRALWVLAMLILWIRAAH